MTISFSGRIRRKEYWTIILWTLVILDVLIEQAMHEPTFIPIFYGSLLLSFGISWMAQVQRLHDINFSGWWVLLNLIPIVGEIILVIMCLIEGNAVDNRFGPDPKAELEKKIAAQKKLYKEE